MKKKACKNEESLEVFRKGSFVNVLVSHLLLLVSCFSFLVSSFLRTINETMFDKYFLSCFLKKELETKIYLIIIYCLSFLVLFFEISEIIKIFFR